MAPKLKKIESPGKKSPKEDNETILDRQDPLSSGDKDPFAPKKNLLGPISPQRNENPPLEGLESSKSNNDEDLSKNDKNSSENGEEQLYPEKEDLKQQISDKKNFEDVISENYQDESHVCESKEGVISPEAEESEYADDEEAKIEFKKKMHDEYDIGAMETSQVAAQEAKINQIVNKVSLNHMDVYRKGMSALFLNVPFHCAVYNDDIDTVKKFLKEDFRYCCRGGAHQHFLDVLDGEKRSVLHIAAAGSSSLMVEYLLTHNKVCLEEIKHSEMKRINEERRSSLIELKKALDNQKKSNPDSKCSFSMEDYRVRGIEKWFESEVSRVHRKVELSAEAYWIKGLTQRDRDGLTPLHHAAKSGSVAVLRALLCVPPFTTGRGIFKFSNKKTVKGEQDSEWFARAGIYNTATGEEVAVLVDQNKGVSGSTFERGKDIADQQTVKANDENAHQNVDYEVVVPWLMRNIHKRSCDMGDKLGASSGEIIEEIIDLVNPMKGRVLILPEIQELLRHLGIVVTVDVIKELCNIYPASFDLVEEKYEYYREYGSDIMASDAKNFSSKFAPSSKRQKKSSKEVDEDDAYHSHDSDYKSESKGGEDNFQAAKSTNKTKPLFDDHALGETDYGLQVDMFLDDIASGKGMVSAFGSEGGGGVDHSGSNQAEHDATREYKEFIMPSIISISSIFQFRSLILECRDSAGNTPLIVAAALDRLQHVEQLIALGANISAEAFDGHTPLNVSSDASIANVIQRKFVSQLHSAGKSFLSGRSSSISAASTRNLSKSTVDFMSTVGSCIKEDAQCPDASQDLLLQLGDLRTKRWGHSQGILAWALEGGMDHRTVEKMLDAGANVNDVDVSGRSSLHTCAQLISQASSVSALQELLKILETLLKSLADIHLTTVSGKTPMHELFSANKSDLRISPQDLALMRRMRALIVRSFLQWGADPLREDRHGSTPLQCCVKEDMSECLVEILNNKNINVYARDPRGRTVLHTACIHGSASSALILSKYDADFAVGIQSMKDNDGKTPINLMAKQLSKDSFTTLWQACRQGNATRVNFIISNRVNSLHASYEGVEEEKKARSALDVTASEEEGSSDLWLLNGVDAKTRIHKWTPLHACIIGWAEFIALKEKNRPAMKLLFQGQKRDKDTNKPSFRSKPGLFCKNASVSSFSAIVSLLIQNFAYVDSLEYKCRSPLMYAAALGLPNAIKLLCSGGADVNLKDIDGNTALHYAYANGSPQCTSVLEDNGADSSIENLKGDTPVEVAGLINSVAPIFKR